MFLKRSFFVLVITSTQLYADLMEINNLKQFNEKIKTGVSVVKFYMDGCAPCKASTPMFTDLSQNNDYKEILEKAGLVFSGMSPDGKLCEIAELPQSKHPFFLGTQFHPEFKARPLAPHPLFTAFIKACIKNKKIK